ncbi:MAG: CRISPR-associated endoribonuclease Cas6 [Aminivibrio sp.]
MLIDLAFDSDAKEFVIPKVNLHLFQAMFYNLLPRTFASFLHNEGFQSDNRRFKLFAFSWPKGSGRPFFSDNAIIMKYPIRLTVATPVRLTMAGITDGALQKTHIRIGNNIVYCSEITLRDLEVKEDSLNIYTLSPITCYSTLYKKTGEPYTLYHSPSDPDFGKQIHANLARKFKALYPDYELPEKALTFTPSGTVREQIARFRPDDPRPIKGWWGKFTLRGPTELLQTALDCGLGAKNSAGFGCVEPARE